MSGIDSLEVGMVDFQSLPDEEKKALHLSWLMVQIYNKILKTPLLNNQEDIAEEAQSTLASARATQKQLLPGLIELADNGTVDIAFAKETKLSRIIEKLFIITNWSMTAIAFYARSAPLWSRILILCFLTAIAISLRSEWLLLVSSDAPS